MTAQCNLIIDSCCDFPHSVVDREGVYLIKFPFLFGRSKHPAMISARARRPMISTSACATGSARRPRRCPFPRLPKPSRRCESGIPTVYLSFSSGLSAATMSLILLPNRCKAVSEMELHIVDTKLASVAEALLVDEAIVNARRA